MCVYIHTHIHTHFLEGWLNIYQHTMGATLVIKEGSVLALTGV